MPEVHLKKLYMAKSMEDLNKRVAVDTLKASPQKLLKSSKILLQEAEVSDKNKDEELAYIYFMRYFSVVKNLQNNEEFKKNKKYFTTLLDTKVTKKAILRAEELSNSLQRRYDLLFIANEPEKKSVLKEAEKNEKETPKVPTSFPVKEETVVSDGFITCEKLFSLTKEKVSSFLVIDVRSKEAFSTSSMKISTLINIPEETLKPGLTASKAGRDLHENSRLLWARRHVFDYIIICDYGTDSIPLPPAVVVLIDAMENWDPGKSYRAKPCVLKGGYEIFCHMYPMLISNPKSTISTFNSFNNNTTTSFLSENLSHLNISFPDLNDGFLSTPSPTENITYPETSDKLFTTPQVNRGLKPKPSLRQIDSKKEDSKDFNNSHASSVNNSHSVDSSSLSNSFHDGMMPNTIPSTASYNHLRPKKAFGGWLASSSSSSDEDYPNDRNEDHKKPIYTVQKEELVPKIPSRSLKPADLLQSYDAKKKILDEGKQILKKSYNAEKNALEKLNEIDETRKSKELSSGTEQMKLKSRETQLRLDLEEAKKRVKEIENEYTEVSHKSKEMSNHLSQMVSDHADNLPSESTLSLIQEMEGKGTLKRREDEQKLLLMQVEDLRKKRKEKEKEMEEQLKREKLEKKREKENEEPRDQNKPNSDRGFNGAEHNNQGFDRQSKINTSRRRPGETYTTKLKISPSSSPVRGGSNLRRSHSALNLSQLKNEDGSDFTLSSSSAFPNIDRGLKPLNSPRWRNVEEARFRNFEPKFGRVPPTKTGLKNLGNTCYMNSIIQCLSNTVLLARYFYQGAYSESLNPKSNQKGQVAVEFGEVVRALWCSQYRSISVYDLKNVVGRHHKPFQGYDQHDSHEFLIKFMDWLHDDLNKVREKLPKMEEQNFENVPDSKAAMLVIGRLEERDSSIVRELFYGLHRSVIICHTCSNRSLTFEPFSVLTLSFPASGRCTLKDMLHEFYKETRIEYRCDSCRRMTNCTRKFDIWKLPPVLIIHLNRFEHDILMKKKQNFVDFPLENLDLLDYLSDHYSYSTYDLYGVSNHYGTIDGGHYTAFCKSPQQTWYKFDDHEVYDISRDAVKTPAAYILFYEIPSNSKSAY